MGPMGFVALISGWISTEVGRLPYTIYGHLRTADSISPEPAAAVGSSLLAYIFVFLVIFAAGIYFILRLMGKAPPPHEAGPPPDIPLCAVGFFLVLVLLCFFFGGCVFCFLF